MFCCGEKVQFLREKLSGYVRRFRQFWQYDPTATDQFESLDFLLTIGGFHCKLSSKWPRRFWHLSIALALFQYFTVLLKTIEVLNSSTRDYLSTVWYLTMLVMITLSWFVKGLRRFDRVPIDNIRQFVNARSTNSGDPAFDAAMRGKFYRLMQTMIAGILGTALVTQLLLMIPSTHRDRIFGLPELFRSYNSIVACVVNIGFISTISIIYVTKYYNYSAVVFSLLLGVKAELQIVNHSFDRILEEVQAKVDDDLKPDRITEAVLAMTGGDSEKDQPAKKSFDDPRSAVLFWKYLNEQIAVVVDQHNETLRNLNLLKNVAEKFFVINFYLTLTALGSIAFVVLNEKFSFSSVMLSLASISVLFYIFVWCYAVDSLQDVSDRIETSIYDLSFALEYDERYRSDFKQVQAGLQIAGLCTRGSVEFNCFQLFRISNELFIDVVNMIYTVLTFLIDMRK